MAAITSAGSGNWSTGATWVGGVAPTSVDDVTIAKNHDVTLGTTTCVAKTVTLALGTTTGDVGAILRASTTANSKLTLELGMLTQGSATGNYRTSLILDLSASPTYSCEIVFNNSRLAAGAVLNFHGLAQIVLKGYPKTRWTKTVGALAVAATGCSVVDATGWQSGDRLVLASTQTFNITPRTDVITGATVSGSDITWAADLTYAHADQCLIGNFSSNVKISVAVDGDRGSIWWTGGTPTAASRVCTNVEINSLNDTSTFAQYAFSFDGTGTTVAYAHTMNDNAFFNLRGNGWWFRNFTSVIFDNSHSGNVYYTTGSYSTGGNNNFTGVKGFVTNEVHFRGSMATQITGETWENVYLSSGPNIASVVGFGANATHKNIHTWASYYGIGCSSNVTLESSSVGSYYPGATCAHNFNVLPACVVTAVDTVFGTPIVNFVQSLNQNSAVASTLVLLLNKNADSSQHEGYTFASQASPSYLRDSATKNRSSSSLRFNTLSAVPIRKSFGVLAKNATPVRIIGYLRKNTSYGSATRPTVEISGMGISPVTHTMSDISDDWEMFDLTVTQSSGADGLLTVRVTAQSSNAAGQAWFDGVPDAPFVTQCRHYGFDLTQETSPTRTVDLYVVATEATAAAYTGITIDGTAKTIAFGAGTGDTAQEFYDYTRAWACLNLSKDIPLNRAGTLYSLAAGWTVVDPAITGLTWGGGTVEWNSTGSKIGSFDSNIFDFTAVGSYDFGNSAFGGTVELVNASGGAVVVALPSGTSYTNTGPDITVNVAVESAEISISSMPNAGAVPTRLQIINTTASTAAAWQATTGYSAGDVRLRTTGVGTESTAGLYMRCTTGGASGGTEPTWNTTPGGTTTDDSVTWTTYKVLFYDADPAATSYSTSYFDGDEFLAGEVVAVRFAEMDGGTSFKTYSVATVAATSGFSALVNEVADEVYATNGLDGSAYESTFSPNFTTNHIVLDSNADFAGIAAYAYFCYTLTSSNGMYRFWGGVTALDVGNYRIESDVLNLYFDESAGFVKQTDAVRIFRKDGLRPALDPTTGGSGIELNWRTPVSVISTGGSALTPTESAKLMALPELSAMESAVLSVNMVEVKGQTITGAGSEADPWGP